MAIRIDFSTETNVGNVADPANAQDVATKNYVDNRPSGGGSLASLSDVQITNPSYIQFGTLTVLAVNGAPFNTITLSIASSTLLGLHIRGGTSLPGMLPSILVTAVNGAVLTLADDPTTYFAVGNNVYYLPVSTDNNYLQFSNLRNKWIATRARFDAPADTFTWVSGSNTYVADPTIATMTGVELTTPAANLTTTAWTFSQPSLALLTSPSVIVVTDTSGRCATGTYTAGVSGNNATFTNVRIERISGGSWEFSTAYRVDVRAGVQVSGGGGATTLTALTDVSVTEPVFSQVGSLTVTLVDAVAKGITLSGTPTGIAVGDWLRGGTSLPGMVAAIQVISILNNSLEFNIDPSTFFAIGNNVYKLPATIHNNTLTFDNSVNKWIAKSTVGQQALDQICWIDRNAVLYATNVSIAIINRAVTTNVSNLMNDWTFDVPTLDGVTSGSAIVLTDDFGRVASGTYLSAASAGGSFAVLTDVLFDRLAGGGFALNTAYFVNVRQGQQAVAPLAQRVSSFLPRYDQAYLCTHNVDDTNFWGYLLEGANESGLANVNFTAAFGNDNYVTGIGFTWNSGSVPTGLASGSSVMIFDTRGRFSISNAVLSLVGGNWFFEGEFNCTYGTTIPIGTYTILINGVEEEGFTLNGIDHSATLVAGTGIGLSISGSDLTITNTSQGSIAGVATGYNIGNSIDANNYIIVGDAEEPQTSIVQIGTGSAYSTDSTIIANGTGNAGWTFGGQAVTNFVAELGAQKQVFRLGVNGTWSDNNVTPLNDADGLTLVYGPYFNKRGRDIDDDADVFPGFTNATTAYAELEPLTGLLTDATARYSLTGGFTVQSISNVTDNGSGIKYVTINAGTGFTLTASSTTMTIPLYINNYNNGNSGYAGSEFVTWYQNGDSTFTIQLPTDAPVNQSVSLGSGVTKVIFWRLWATSPPTTGSVFTNGIIEVAIAPNVWTLASNTLQPNGFTLPTNTTQWQLTWLLDNHINQNAFTSVEFHHFNSATDSWYAPNAQTQWNNRFTVDYGSGLVTIPSLSQVLGVGNTTGNNNIVLSGTGKLSGAVGSLNITGGLAGQFLSTDGSGNQSWAAAGGGSLSVWSETGYHVGSGSTVVSTIKVTATGKTLAQVNTDFPAGAIITASFATAPAYTQLIVALGGAVDLGSNNYQIPLTASPPVQYAGSGVARLFTNVSPLVFGDGLIRDQYNRYSANPDGSTIVFNSNGQLSATGGAGTGTLQQVLTAGNTANNININLTGTSRLVTAPTGLNVSGGVSGQFLRTDGSGNLSFANTSFYFNPTFVPTNPGSALSRTANNGDTTIYLSNLRTTLFPNGTEIKIGSGTGTSYFVNSSSYNGAETLLVLSTAVTGGPYVTSTQIFVGNVSSPYTSLLVSGAGITASVTNNALTLTVTGETLTWAEYATASRYNTAFTPVTGISATFTTPAATTTGTVHSYYRYSALGVATQIYRFVPTTDSALTTLSYDSFWSTFSSNTLSGLLVQRGNF